MLQDAIDSRRKFLDGLGGQLKDLKTASLPLQQHLALPISVEEKRKRAARLLPPPLYIVYTQLAAAKEAFQDDFAVEITGSVADAETLVRKAAAAEAEKGKQDGEAEDEPAGVVADAKEDDGEDEEGGRAAKRARTTTEEGSGGAGEQYAAHPLKVELRLSSPSATFKFAYMSRLHVVTVEAVGDNVEADLLLNLFPGDTGADTPNISNKLLSNSFTVYDEARRDRPYRWAQHLAGLDFLPALPLSLGAPAEAAAGISEHQQQARVRNVLAALRARMASRSKLK